MRPERRGARAGLTDLREWAKTLRAKTAHDAKAGGKRLPARLAVAVLGVLAIAQATQSQEFRQRARVAVQTLDYYDIPNGRGFTAGVLSAGDEVEVLRIEPSGWAAIEPPPDAFCWLDADSLEVDADGSMFGLVIGSDVVLRVGREGARMPGPPRFRIRQGDRVKVASKVEPLQVGDRTWRAIVPPPGVVYYVPANSLREEGGRPLQKPEPVRAEEEVIQAPLAFEIADDLTSVGPKAPEGRVPPGLLSQVQAVEAEHRAILRRPIVGWQLALIRARYQSLLRQAVDTDSTRFVQGHLDQVTRQQAAAESSRRVAELLSKPGLTIEGEKSLEEYQSRSARRRPFDVEGMLQPSSKLVRGKRVYALIGDSGHSIAYLLAPPGLLMGPLLSRQVGVRGVMSYDESLRAKIVEVVEIEALSPAP